MEVMSRKRKTELMPYLLIVPSIIFVVAILIYPIGRAVMLSFYRVNLLTYLRRSAFVGLSNYSELILDRYFWNAVKITFIFTGGSVAGTYILGLLTALLVNLKFRGRGLARGLLLLPWVVPEVVLVLIWIWIYDPQFGVLNFFLRKLQVIDYNLYLLGSPSLALGSILVTLVWRQYPLAMLMILAGLQSIPNEQYEVASIDGANVLQRFRSITLPNLRYVSSILILLLTVWGFVEFVVIYLMTQGGPARSTETLIIRTYLEAFKFYELGRACAQGVVILGISLVFAVVYFRFLIPTARESKAQIHARERNL